MTKKTAAEIAAEIAWEHVYTRAPQEADEADIRRFADQVAARVVGRMSPGAPLPTLAVHWPQPTHEGDVEDGAAYPDPSAAGTKAGDHATVTGEEAADSVLAAEWRSQRKTTEAERARVTTEQLTESVSTEDRMALRHHPDVIDAARALATAAKLSATHGQDYRSAIWLVSVLVERLRHPLDHASRMTSDDPALTAALAIARNRTNVLTRNIDNPRAAERDRAAVLIPYVQRLSEDLSGAIEDSISHHGPGRWALEETLDRSRNLARAVSLALLYASPPQQREARYASPLQENLLELVKLCVDEVRRTVSSVLGREVPLLDEESVKSFLNDFTTSDLRTADLAGVDLGGVRWSENETRWPTTLDITELKAHSRETPAGSGIYIVEPGTTPAHVHRPTSS
ncbi:hypothetical protein ACIGDI_40195 [Streptomyces sp. NPDC085900]|uniref:hypothetical protein n=1 Tax=Streptomyces sp. NPDC085900 TaxID=3365737 RepID=UPI0037CFCA73